MIENVTLYGGCGRNGRPEPVSRIDLRMGDIVSIVGRSIPSLNHEP